jgi:hypothetical protein
MDLTPQQFRILERISVRGFQIVAFPMCANHVGVRRGNCAVLLTPVASGGLGMYTEPTFFLAGNLSARINRKGREWFVWKSEAVEATQELVSELEGFSRELKDMLLPTA